MGNAVVNNNILDVCYGLRLPLLPHVYNQPVIKEFNLDTGEKLLDITICDQSAELVNFMYQINRGVNIYEDQ
jgi:hypothetical protein